MATDQFGTGGWHPGLVSSSLGIGGDIEFLASEHYTVKRAGCTFDAAVVSADGNGDKIVPKGTFVGPRTANGKYARPSEGGTFDANSSGYTMEAINLRWGDVTAGILIHGSVLRARVTVSPAASSTAVATAVAGRIIFQ